MLKIFAAVLLAVSIYADAANARGGAEPMPGISLTDMPSYSAKPQFKPIKPKHVRWRRGIARNH